MPEATLISLRQSCSQFTEMWLTFPPSSWRTIFSGFKSLCIILFSCKYWIPDPERHVWFNKKKKNTFIKDIAEKIPPVSSILKATCFHTELLRTWLRMFAGFVHMATGLNKLFLCSSEWGGCCELRPGGTTAGQISCPKGDRRELILWSSWELRRKKNQPGLTRLVFRT